MRRAGEPLGRAVVQRSTTVDPVRGTYEVIADRDSDDTYFALNPLALHGGAPVLEAEKWIATKWMRERRYAAA